MKKIRKSYGTILINNNIVERQSLLFPSLKSSTTKSIPKNFDGRIVWKNYLSPIKTQGDCGICYATSTVEALADRYALLTNNEVHVELSASDMVMCLDVDPEEENIKSSDYLKAEREIRDKFGLSCNGNTLYNAAKYLCIEGVPDEKCIPDKLVMVVPEDEKRESERSLSTDKNNEFTEEEKERINDISNIIKNGAIDMIPKCEYIEGKDYDMCIDGKTALRKYRAIRAYRIEYDENDLEKTENRIMSDIYKWGPLSTGFLVYDEFLHSYDGLTTYTTKGEGEALMGHAINIVGWGEEVINDRVVKYWICANNWGEDWGDKGYFKIERFLPGLDLEKNTMALIPDIINVIYWDVYMETEDYNNNDDIVARSGLGLNIFNLYTANVVEKIKQGLLIGELDRLIIDPRHLRKNYKNFYAGELGEKKKINFIFIAIVAIIIIFIVYKIFSI